MPRKPKVPETRGGSAVLRARIGVRAVGFFLAALICIAAAGARAARPAQFRQVSLPASTLNPKVLVHPVDLWGDNRLEFVVVRPTGEIEIVGWEREKLVSQQHINLPASSGPPTYYSFAKLAKDEKYTLIALTPDGLLYWARDGERLDPTPQKLLPVRVPAAAAVTDSPEAVYYEMGYDLDGDGSDELLIPQRDQFAIYHAKKPYDYAPLTLPRDPFKYSASYQFRRQLPDDPVRVPSISGAVVYRHGVDDLVFFDANGDGREDLVYTSVVHAPKSREIEHYEIFFQRPGLTFGSVPDQVIEIPYDERAYVTFRDFDRDGRCEAFAVASNYDIVAPRTNIRIIGGEGGKTTSTRERFRLVTKDPIGLVRLMDFDHDGHEDFACTFFSYQFTSTEDIASLVAANRVRFRLQFYLGQAGKLFARRPNYEYELNLSLKPESYGSYPPFYLVDDMNGDGIADLVARADETRLAVYLSENRLSFPRQPSATFMIPNDAAVSFADCDGDGLLDIILTSIQKQSVTLYLSPSPKGP